MRQNDLDRTSWRNAVHAMLRTQWRSVGTLCAMLSAMTILSSAAGPTPIAAQDQSSALVPTGRIEFYLQGHIADLGTTSVMEPVFNIGDSVEFSMPYWPDDVLEGTSSGAPWADYSCRWCTDRSWLRVGTAISFVSQQACGEMHLEIHSNYSGWALPTLNGHDLLTQTGSFCDGGTVYPHWINLVYQIANPAGAIGLNADGLPQMPHFLDVTDWTPWLNPEPFRPFGRLEFMAQQDNQPVALEVAYFEVDYAVFRPEYEEVSDGTAPRVNCEQPDGHWHGSDVSLVCTATDEESGLVNDGEATFILTTSVASGTETSNASTGSRSICDAAGNCTQAGPIAGNKVDKKAPTIDVSAPTNGTYVLGQTQAASYACADEGSGVAACVGAVANGANVPTSSSGTQTFVVTATDAAGHSTSETVQYRVNYNTCLLYDPTKARQSGSTIPIRIQLCDVASRNLSSSSAVVTATGVYLVSNQAPGVLEDSGSANPDFNFRFTGDSYLFNLSLKGYGQGTYALTFVVGTDPAPYSVPFQVK